MESHDHVSDSTDNESAIYRQVEELFLAGVLLPSEERLDWARRLTNRDPGVVKLLIAALEADMACDHDSPVDDRSELQSVSTIVVRAADTQPVRPRPFPVIPNYEIIEEIDRGGMGIVYRARQKRPERIVAIKMMKSGVFTSSKDTERFLNEANAASTLEHMAVVPVYEVGEISGELFITMKFINGETLERLLCRGGISADSAIRNLAVVAKAVAELHERGIIHRDLKPSNILIESGTGRPWVTDFGLAKRLEADAKLTTVGDIIGTPGYMAPEQASASGNAVSRAADVYGLGAILYRILTGRPPILAQNGDLVRTIELIREHDIVAPRDRDRRITPELNTLCVKSLETDPSRRYQHAGEFADDLQRCVDGDAILARPQGLIRKLHRWARHRPGLTVTLCVLIVFCFYHVVAISAGLHLDSDAFNRVVMVIAPLAAINAWFWQTLLRRTEGAGWTLYAWSTGETLLLTILVIAGDGANSGLVSAYSVLVAASILRCRPLLVCYVATLTVVSLAVVWFYTAIILRHTVNPLITVPQLLTLSLIGIVQFISLRQSSVSLEAQAELNRHHAGRHP